MGNWLFLILLYFFFGWMKKRQQTKAREKIESQEDWNTGNFAKFKEEILENFLGEEREDEEEIIEEQKAYEKEEDSLDAEIIQQDEKGDSSSPSILTEQYTENLEKELSLRIGKSLCSFSASSPYKINPSNSENILFLTSDSDSSSSVHSSLTSTFAKSLSS